MANEKRLIDANALMDEFRAYMAGRYDRKKCISEENCKACDRPCLWWRKVNEASTVDAVEVVHGKWHKPTPCSQEFCTNCGLTPKTNFGWLPPYCPNCGAKMDGDGNV